MSEPYNTNNLVKVEAEGLRVKHELAAVEIVDQQTYDDAVEKRTTAAAFLKTTQAFFKELKDPAYAAWKNICDKEKLVCGPVESALAQTNRRLVEWDTEQERLRREAQRALEEQARKEAEEQALAEAEHAQATGAAPESVEAILEAPIVAAPVQAPATYQKSSSVQYRDNWKGECFDIHALIKAAAKRKDLAALLQVNQPALNSMAKGLKEQMAVPGCKAVNDRIAATGRIIS